MAPVNADMIVVARDAHSWSQKELAERVGISQGKISKYENGLLEVSEEDLEAIAYATGFRSGLFRSTEPIYGLGSSALFHRKKKTTPIGVQRRVQAKVNIARLQLAKLLRAAEIETTSHFEPIDVDKVEDGAIEVAQRVRAAWRMPMGPVRSVTAAIEAAGGVVLLCDFGTDDIDAAHLWAPGQPPMFFMNANRPGDRHRFNLAHELGHAIMHQFPTGDIEAEANQFASEFLMPRKEIAPELRGLTIQRAAQLKPRWKTAIAALIYAAHSCGAISESKRGILYAQLSRLGYRKAEPIEIELEQPTLVPQLVDLHRKALGYSDEDLLDLLMTDNPDFINTVADETMKIRPGLRMDDGPISFEAHIKRA